MQELTAALRTLLAEREGPLLSRPELIAWYQPAPPERPVPQRRAPSAPPKATNSLIHPIALLIHPLPHEERVMIDRLAEALSQHCAPTSVIERHCELVVDASELRLAIVSETTLKALPNLARKYQPPKEQGLGRLGSTPAFIMADPALYLKDPSMKRGLWNGLLETFRSLR